jgi:hypothetical protein
MALLAGVAACNNSRQTTTPASSNSIAVPAVPSAEAPAPAAAPKSSVQVPKLVHIPVENLPPCNASRKAYLSGGWWNFNAAVSGAANEEMLIAEYRHKWLKFREDQTFDLLVGNKVVTSGKWGWDEPASTLYLSCADPFVNGAWAIKNSGFTMIWIGNSPYTTHGYQLRLYNTKNEPPSN